MRGLSLARIGRKFGNSIFALISISGCGDMSDYSADYRIIDNGIFAAADRYVIDFGKVDFHRASFKEYRLSSLPNGNFVIGVEVEGQINSLMNETDIDPVLELKIMNSSGEALVHKLSKLSSWTWSVFANETKAFVYGRGVNGTFFKSSRKSQYRIIVAVHKPYSGQATFSATLLAKSGGWK